MIHLYLCWRPQATSFLDSVGGLVGSNLSGKAQRKKSTGRDMFVHCDLPLPVEGAGSCASPGGWRGEIGMRPRNARRSAQTE